jgi:redox-sensitive bicupin YhaK (pirin superfamily)
VISLRRSEERGRTQLDWLDSQHSFSFDQYYDPNHVRFSVLRVLNEDRVAPGAGFPTHPHRDMEILTWVLAGALEHRDSLGNGSVIRAGELQRMSAGTGVTHSEFNASPTEPVHLLQIWLLPRQRGLAPGYEQRSLAGALEPGRLVLAASPDGREHSVRINQDAWLYLARLEPGPELAYRLPPGRHAYLHVARGAVRLKGERLAAGDAAKLSDEPGLALAAHEPSEVLLFDLP